MKYTLIVLAVLGLSSSCATTHGMHVSDAPNMWVNVGKKDREELMFCKANATDKGAKPVCYVPEMP